MVNRIEKALGIINRFDWFWKMDDSNYKSNKAKAEEQKNRFVQLLKGFDCTREDERRARTLLKDLWMANYDMSRPYEKTDYYKRKEADIALLEIELSELTNRITQDTF